MVSESLQMVLFCLRLQVYAKEKVIINFGYYLVGGYDTSVGFIDDSNSDYCARKSLE